MSRFYPLPKHRFTVVLTVFLSLPFIATAQQGMRVGSSAAPSEMLHVEGAILLGTTSNTNAGTIRWNGTDFQGYNGSTWVSLNSAGALYTAGTGLILTGTTFSHATQTAIDVNATNNGTNVIDQVVVNTLGHVTSVVARDLSAATTSAAGVMSAADKTKLDGIATGATANAGTVTSVAALTLGTTGTDLSSSVANSTSTPVITLNVPTASASNRGALSAADWSTFNAKENALTFSTGLTRNVNTITNNLSTGVAGGQTAIGGTAAGNSLTLSSTTNATKGKILFGNSAYDEVNNRLGLGNTAPDYQFDVKGVGIDAGPGTFDNVLGRFEQNTAARGAGIQIKGYRNTSGNITSFVDLRNQSTTNYSVARMAALREAGEAGSLLLYTNSGTALTERVRINSAGVVQLNAYTTNGIVRATGGNGTLSTAGGGVNLASEVTGVLPVANGGTGSATQNFVDLTTAQTAAGVKTWSNNAIFNGLVGIGTSVFPAVSRLTLAGFTGTEGGEIQLNGGSSYTNSAFVMDNFEGRFRLIKGSNTAGSGAGSTELLSFKGTNQLGIGNIGGNAWPSESNLIIGDNGGVEGGQIQFYNASGAGTAWFLDVENNNFRFLTGNNITGSSGLALAISNSGDFTASGSIRSNNGRFYGQTGCDNYLSLQSDGNMVLYNSGGGALWNTSTNCSDIRTKTDIVPMESVLSGLLDLSVIRFNYKKELNISDAPQIGVIAQQIQAKYPEMIYHNEETDRYLVQYEKLTALLLKGMQEQQEMIKALQEANTSVNEKLKNYASLVSDIELLKEAVGIDKRAQK